MIFLGFSEPLPEVSGEHFFRILASIVIFYQLKWKSWQTQKNVLHLETSGTDSRVAK